MKGLYETTPSQIDEIANNASHYWSKTNDDKSQKMTCIRRAINEFCRRISQEEFTRVYRKVSDILKSRGRGKSRKGMHLGSPIAHPKKPQPKKSSPSKKEVLRSEVSQLNERLTKESDKKEAKKSQEKQGELFPEFTPTDYH